MEYNECHVDPAGPPSIMVRQSELSFGPGQTQKGTSALSHGSRHVGVVALISTSHIYAVCWLLLLLRATACRDQPADIISDDHVLLGQVVHKSQ